MANERNRPALVTFAGIMMIMVGMFNLTTAIAGLTNASWLDQFNVDIGNNLLWASLVDLGLAIGFFIAAYSIFKGTGFGYFWGLSFTILNASKWFFVIFWFPIAAIVVIAIDALIIYALASNPRWFGFNWLGSLD